MRQRSALIIFFIINILLFSPASSIAVGEDIEEEIYEIVGGEIKVMPLMRFWFVRV